MIEKWENEEDWDKLEDWCDKVENAIGEYHTNKLFNGLYDAYLSMNNPDSECGFRLIFKLKEVS
jgi:hypothetical protein